MPPAVPLSAAHLQEVMISFAEPEGPLAQHDTDVQRPVGRLTDRPMWMGADAARVCYMLMMSRSVDAWMCVWVLACVCACILSVHLCPSLPLPPHYASCVCCVLWKSVGSGSVDPQGPCDACPLWSNSLLVSGDSEGFHWRDPTAGLWYQEGWRWLASRFRALFPGYLG